MANSAKLVVLLTVLVCFAAGSYAARIEPKAMTSRDAQNFARRALKESGVEGATLVGKVESKSFTPHGLEPVKVWSVSAKVGDDTFVMYIEQVGDQVLNLDDQIGPGRNVLSNDEFKAMGRFRYDPVQERARDRQLIPALFAGAIAGAVGASLALAVGRRDLFANSERVSSAEGHLEDGDEIIDESDAIDLQKIEVE